MNKKEYDYSYEGALKAAGAEILASESFGSYQGDMWIKVAYNGQVGWINIAYGSCSGCDTFDAEFSYEYDDPEKLIKFGEGYLHELMDYDQAIKEASSNLDWDSEAKDMVKFIEENK